MRHLAKLLIIALSLLAIAKYGAVAGVIIGGGNPFKTAFLVSLVFWLMCIFVRPIISIITLPLNLITLGLFRFVVNAFLFWAVVWFVPGFSIGGFIPAFIVALIISAIDAVLDILLKKKD
jgi:putative membrane protein